MDIVDASVVESLVEASESPAISIYLPTHRFGPDNQQDPIRLKNLLGEAEARLTEQGMRSPEVADLLAPATDLLDDVEFWQHQEDGLALFLSPQRSDRFRVPQTFDEAVVVSDSFFVSPLLPVMSRGERFFVLALSENEVRLLWGSRFRVGEVELGPDVPTSIAEALWFEDPERQLQFHQAGRSGQGRVTATFHGHGGGKDDPGERLERFLRAVDDGVRTLVAGGAPVVLAGVERVMAGYRKITRLEGVVEDGVEGSPDRLTPETLHDEAWPLVAPRFEATRAEGADEFLSGSRPISADVDEVLRMANEGRVAHAFIPAGTDDRRFEQATAAIWKTGGEVWIVPAEEIPAGGPVAAVLRY
ncbi:MAG: hypothetical protein WEE36_11115 [Acidimicrobiia bacterium]